MRLTKAVNITHIKTNIMGNTFIDYKFVIGEKITVGLSMESARFWNLEYREELTVTGNTFFLNGEDYVGTNKGVFPTIFFYIREEADIQKDVRKTDVKGFSFWAKRLDTYAHIVKIDSNNVGGEVYCGRFGALLGNNYASDLTYVCPDCLEKIQSEGTTVI